MEKKKVEKKREIRGDKRCGRQEEEAGKQAGNEIREGSKKCGLIKP